MRNGDKPFAFRGNYLLLAAGGAYIALFVFNREIAMAALLKSAGVAARILPIIAGVIIFTAVLNYFLRPEQMVKHLGKQGGLKAWGWTLGAGILSHGPMYLWYPTLEDLRHHGMRDGLIVTFFAARAIKIPPLPLMIGYFGLKFVLVLAVYIVLGALMQGWLFEKMEQTR